jgi:Sortase domain
MRRPRTEPVSRPRGAALGIAAVITAFALAGVVIGIFSKGGTMNTVLSSLGANGTVIALPPPASSSAPSGSVPNGDDTPARVDVDKIDAHSTLVQLALNADRTVQVPPPGQPLQAGWYRLGAKPGDLGRAVILGRADGNGQPGIFARLRQLAPGDTARITRQDGQVLRFVVRRVHRTDFPARDVSGASNNRELLLITYAGTFDPATGSFPNNVIVSAVLAP